MSLKVNKSLTPPIVSRETINDFKSYYQMLFQWNKSISLMKLTNWDDFYQRHVLDSLQLCEILDKDKKIIDIGSGAGVPAIFLALMKFDITMIESISKKTTFLKQVVKNLNIDANIITDRIENFHIREPIIITARALTSLSNLFSYSKNVSRETIGIFLKGKTLEAEIVEAQKEWLFDFEIYNSMTGDGYIIKTTNLRRKGM